VKGVKIVAVLACHNRRSKTIKCFERYFITASEAGVLPVAILLDDGSSDGTADAVKKQFPWVEIIDANGSLFWNGGMRAAIARAMEMEFDFILWLNDDVVLRNDALFRLLNTYELKKIPNNATLVGATKDISNNNTSYSGIRVNKGYFSCSFERIIPRESPVKADTMNGNIVLIPRQVVFDVGNLFSGYTHGMGDYDYGLRIVASGYTIWVAPGYFGECDGHEIKNSRYDKELSFKERVNLLKGTSGLPPTDEWLLFIKRNFPSLWPFYWFRSVIREKFPILWVILRRSPPGHFK